MLREILLRLVQTVLVFLLEPVSSKYYKKINIFWNQPSSASSPRAIWTSPIVVDEHCTALSLSFPHLLIIVIMTPANHRYDHQYHHHHHDTCEAQAQVMFSAAVMLVSKPKIGTPVSFATHLYWLKRNNWNLSQIKSNFSADTPAGTTAQTLLRLKHSLRKTIPRKLFPRYKITLKDP